MKIVIYLALVVCMIILYIMTGYSQGCVGVRPMSCSSSGNSGNLMSPEKNSFQASLSYRYYKSHRHYRGDVEQKERKEQDTEVVNITHSAEIGIAYGITDRSSLTVNIPFIYYDRSSLYEHYGNSASANPLHKRFHTGANGIGDMRLSFYYTIINPHKDSLRGNILAGFGIKFPTGNAKVEDEFHRIAADDSDSTFTRPVDQSIQLGDGGWGINPEIQAYFNLSKRFSLYMNAYYLFNPRNVNETLTRGTAPKTFTDSLTGWHSVADQYAVRLGISHKVCPKQGVGLSIGARMEGIPSKDLIGKSEGFRRPGYIVSAEPGVSLVVSRLNIFVSVPVALYRNRIKSYSDLERDKIEPQIDHHGDAAFADYLINASLAYRFGKKDMK